MGRLVMVEARALWGQLDLQVQLGLLVLLGLLAPLVQQDRPARLVQHQRFRARLDLLAPPETLARLALRVPRPL